MALLVPSSAQANEDYARSIICSFPWPCHEAMEVARCESNFVIGIDTNPPYVGWFQVEYGSYDEVENTAQAFVMWTTRGWYPWPVCGRPFR